MMDLPPYAGLWLPPRPAIIRPADKRLLRLATRDAIKAEKAFKQASFLPGMFPAGAIAAAAPTPAALSYIGITKSAAAAQNFTFSSVNIGAAASTRRLIIVLSWTNSVAHRTISSFTKDGVAMPAAHVNVSASPGFNGGDIAIYSVLAPTGTTANFQINTSGTNVHMTMSVYNAFNETATTPHATMADGTLTGNTLDGTINIPNNGWVLATSSGFGTPTPASMNWTGVTSQYQDVLGSTAVRNSGALASLLPLQSARPISAVIPSSTAGQSGALAAISWG